MEADAAIEALRERVERLEGERAVRACMHRYMALCDALDADTPLDELVGLFTPDAVWEGVGARYSRTFRRVVGHAGLRALFGKYMGRPAHFALNVHFLGTEHIAMRGAESAVGHWLLQQASSFAAGGSHLTAARLTVDFVRQDGTWRMRHFRTENLFGRPVDAWNDAAPLPVPN
ncbi:MAG TPA: nuclear transport factor 2 family protein [Ramlibacter sp.]|nr:nuclear transport factor 2 family protein [Ramlibacter sp.]